MRQPVRYNTRRTYSMRPSVRWRGMPGRSLPRRDGLGFQKSALMLGHGTTSCNGACRASPLHAPCSMRPRVLRAHNRGNRRLTVTQPTLQSLVNSEAHVRDREIDKLKQVLRRWALWAIRTFTGWLRWARPRATYCIHRPRGSRATHVQECPSSDCACACTSVYVGYGRARTRCNVTRDVSTVVNGASVRIAFAPALSGRPSTRPLL